MSSRPSTGGSLSFVVTIDHIRRGDRRVDNRTQRQERNNHHNEWATKGRHQGMCVGSFPPFAVSLIEPGSPSYSSFSPTTRTLTWAIQCNRMQSISLLKLCPNTILRRCVLCDDSSCCCCFVCRLLWKDGRRPNLCYYIFCHGYRMLPLTSRRNSTESTDQLGTYVRHHHRMWLRRIARLFRLGHIYLTQKHTGLPLCVYRHVIVGRNFGSYVTHETKHFIYFYLGQVAILLFKSG